MSRIKAKNTSLEKLVFRYLRKNKIYFQKHYKKAPGNPDIALPRKKIAIFVDGDFWHGWRINKIKKRLPKGYWIKKIETNVKRDIKNRSELRKMGWKILRIWQHDIEKRKEKTLNEIIRFVS